jgi:hypothetical protein
MGNPSAGGGSNKCEMNEKTSRDKFITCVFLAGVNTKKYGRLKTKLKNAYYIRITLIREPGKPAHFGLQRDKPPRRLLDCVDLRTKATIK